MSHTTLLMMPSMSFLPLGVTFLPLLPQRKEPPLKRKLVLVLLRQKSEPSKRDSLTLWRKLKAPIKLNKPSGRL